MPCALTEPDNYPDYLKSYLKEIAVGNNEELKTCACQLKTPLNNEGCPIVDEDGKVGAFPFCVTNIANISVGGICGGPEWYACSYEQGSGLTLKQAMRMYWLTVGIKIGTIKASDNKVLTEIGGIPGDGGSPICSNIDIDLLIGHFEEQSSSVFNLNGLYYDGTSFYFPFNNHWFSNNPYRIKFNNNIFYFSAPNPPEGEGSQNVITIEPIYGNIRSKTYSAEFSETTYNGASPYIYYFRR